MFSQLYTQCLDGTDTYQPVAQTVPKIIGLTDKSPSSVGPRSSENRKTGGKEEQVQRPGGQGGSRSRETGYGVEAGREPKGPKLLPSERGTGPGQSIPVPREANR